MEWGEAQALRGETVLGDVLDITCLDDTYKAVINSAVPIRDADGTIVGAGSVFEDDTQQKLLEPQLLQKP